MDVDPGIKNEFDALCSSSSHRPASVQILHPPAPAEPRPEIPAAQQFGRWVHAGREVLPGLIKRRDDERSLFLELA